MSINVEKDDVPPGPLRELVLSKQKLDAMPEFPGKKEGMKMFNHILKESKRYLAPTKNESVVWEKLGVDVKNRSKKLGFIPYSILEDHKLSEKPKGRCDEVFEFAKSAALEGIKKAYDQLMEEGGDADLKTLFEDLLPASHRVTNTSSEPSENISADQATKHLLSVMFIGSLCKRKGERDCIHGHNTEITNDHLLKLSTFSESISQATNVHMLPKRSAYVPVSNPISNRSLKRERTTVKQSLRDRIILANELVESHQDIKDLIGKITMEGSKYMTTDGLALPDYLNAKIGVFWNLSLKIPKDRAPGSFVAAIGSFLRDHKYKGEYSIVAYGKLNDDEKKNLEKLRSGSIEVAHIPNLTMKDTSEKDILSGALTWAWNCLMKFHEPQVVVFMTDDTDILSTVKQLEHRNFRVLVLRSESDKNIKLAVSVESLWSELMNKMELINKMKMTAV